MTFAYTLSSGLSCHSFIIGSILYVVLARLTLKSWIKRADFQPDATDSQNRSDKRQRELEAEIRLLRKQLAEKDEVIDVLKNPSAMPFRAALILTSRFCSGNGCKPPKAAKQLDFS